MFSGVRRIRTILAPLLDLVLPAECAGCGAGAPAGLCPDCAAVLWHRPAPTRPTPAPAGLPPCLALGDYDGPLRELILAYKERGRRDLVAPLGDALAAVVLVAAGVRATLTLVPVPDTPAAARARHGDHMLRLARRAARWLRHRGVSALVCSPLRALPRTDSVHLDRADRARSARDAFVPRQGRVAALQELVAGEPAARVVLLDDVLTTGATLAAVADRLDRCGVPVAAAVTLAATRLRSTTTRL